MKHIRFWFNFVLLVFVALAWVGSTKINGFFHVRTLVFMGLLLFLILKLELISIQNKLKEAGKK